MSRTVIRVVATMTAIASLAVGGDAHAEVRASVTEYPLPPALPIGASSIAVADDGAAWFTSDLLAGEDGGPLPSGTPAMILRLDPGSGTLGWLPLSLPRADRVVRMPDGRMAVEQSRYGGPPSMVSILDPRTRAFDDFGSVGRIGRPAVAPDGSLWAAEQIPGGSAYLTQLGPGSAMRRLPIGHATVDSELLFDTAGGIWFMDAAASSTEPAAVLWRLDPATGTLSDVALPRSYVGAGSAAAGSDGRLYFAFNVIDLSGRDSTLGGMFAVDPQTRIVSTIALPDRSRPIGLAVGPDDALWVTPEGSQGILLRYDHGDGSFDRFALPRAETLLSVAPGVDRDLWLTETGRRVSLPGQESLEPLSVWRVRLGDVQSMTVGLRETLRDGLQTLRSCQARCSMVARVEWRRGSGARASASAKRSGRVVAAARKRRARAGDVRLRLRFRPAAARALRRRSRVHLTVRTRVRTTGRGARSYRSELTLRRGAARLRGRLDDAAR